MAFTWTPSCGVWGVRMCVLLEPPACITLLHSILRLACPRLLQIKCWHQWLAPPRSVVINGDLSDLTPCACSARSAAESSVLSVRSSSSDSELSSALHGRRQEFSTKVVQGA